MELRQSMKDIFKDPVLLLLYLLFFVNPLVMSNDTKELFEFPKMFFVYSIGVIIFAVFLTSLVLKKRKIVMPGLAVLLYVLTSAVSYVVSSHPYTSFWGYYSRFNDGLLSIIIYLVIYFVLINKFNSSGFFRMMKVISLTVFPIGLIGALQHFGLGTGVVERVFSTFGQPNWLAQYLVMILPFILFLFISEMLIFWALLFVIGFACLWFTYSMSGIVGFVLTSLVFVVLFVIKKKLDKNAAKRISVVYLICFFIALTNLGMFKDKLGDAFKDFRDTVSVEKVLALENDYKVSDPGYIRFGLWRGTLNLVISSPKVFFLGTGLETFPYSFQPHRPVSLNYSSEWEYVFNKPHNYFLETLAEAGLVGFAAYFFLLLRIIKKLPFYIIPGFVGFFVTNVFGWPVVSTALLFWFWAGWSEADNS